MRDDANDPDDAGDAATVFGGGRRHEEDTPASERNSMLIARFIEDQLAVRPPISQAEVDDLKRGLERTGDAAE